MSFGQDDVWTNPVNDAMRRSTGGGRGPDTNSIGLYRNIKLDPSPWGKLIPWKCWTVLLHAISESYSLMIVFFENAMVTGHSLGPPTAKPDENFLDPRMDIHYRGGRKNDIAL